MAKGQGSIPGQARIFQILFEPLRSFILLRRSCCLSRLEITQKKKKPGQTSPAVSRIPVLIRTKLRAVSLLSYSPLSETRETRK